MAIARSLIAAVGSMSAAAWIAETPACAQTAPVATASDAPALEQIIVTADRKGSYSADFVQAGSFRDARQLDTPLTVNVIPDALLQSQQAQSLLDALRNTAGVSPSQVTTTVYSNIAIRGIRVENRTNYRLNGTLPIVNLVDLPLEDKDRIEVLKGASALYYGFTTAAGIVNLTMKRPTLDRYTAATVFANEYGAVGAHVDASNTWGLFGLRLNAVYGSVDSGIDDTRGRRSLLSAALDFRPSDTVTVTLDAEQIEKSVNEPGVFRYIALPKPTPTDLYPALELPPLLDPSVNFGPDWGTSRGAERNVLAEVSWKISPAWVFSASYGNSHLARDRRQSTIDLDRYGANTSGDGTLSIGSAPGATYENTSSRSEIAGAANLGFMHHELLIGVSRNIRDTFTAANVPVACPGATPASPPVPCRQNIFAPVDFSQPAFAEPAGTRDRTDDAGYYFFDRIELARWLKAVVGARKTDYKETSRDTGAVTFEDEPTSVSYGVILQPRPSLSVYASYIEGLEATPGAPLTAANAGTRLPTTESTQREVGIKTELRPGLLLQVAYFDIERSSAFVNGANLWVLDGRARFRGTEVSVTGEVTPSWSLYATGQSLDALQISGAETSITTNPATGAVTVLPTVVGRRIENTPARTFSLATEHRLSSLLPGFSVNAAAYYVSERAVNQFNQAFIPSYTLFDLGAAYTCTLGGNPITFRVTDQNVANEKYFSSTGASLIAQGPPRTVKFSATMRF
jgi:iron complex outermembrane receptor protein